MCESGVAYSAVNYFVPASVELKKYSTIDFNWKSHRGLDVSVMSHKCKYTFLYSLVFSACLGLNYYCLWLIKKLISPLLLNEWGYAESDAGGTYIMLSVG